MVSKLFSDAFLLGMNLGGVKYFPDCNQEYYSEFIHFIRKTKKSLCLFLPETDFTFFCKPFTLSSLDSILGKNSDIKIIFHGQESSKLKEDCLSELTEKYLDRLKISFLPFQLKSHYGVSDNEHVFIEGDNSEIYFFNRDKAYARKIGESFDKFISLLDSHNLVRSF